MLSCGVELWSCAACMPCPALPCPALPALPCWIAVHTDSLFIDIGQRPCFAAVLPCMPCGLWVSWFLRLCWLVGFVP